MSWSTITESPLMDFLMSTGDLWIKILSKKSKDLIAYPKPLKIRPAILGLAILATPLGLGDLEKL